MIEYLLKTFSESSLLINLLGYISTRSLMAGMSALIASLILGKYTINWLRKLQVGQYIRDDGPSTHLIKQGTPTMGGVLIILTTSISTILWMRIDSIYIWICLATLISFGAIGFLDDWLKIKEKNSNGLSKKAKFLLQIFCGFLIAFTIYLTLPEQNLEYQIPFLKNYFFGLGVFFILVSTFLLVGFSNAANLTDGLDGLVIMPVLLIALALGIFSYVSGHIQLSEYLYIPYYAGVGELSVVCAAIIGSSFGFLWFNSYPAQIFMGDVGSLALGALLTVIAILIRQEIIYIIMAGVFVVEVLSVIIQVTSFKIRKKRVFLMSPIHHHFEKKGMKEPKIIVRFWIITAILVMIGLASLKIR